MGFLGVILAAAAGFGVGAIWYGGLSARWMVAVGTTKEEIADDNSPLPFVIAGLAALLAAGMMRHMFVTGEVTGWLRCGAYGAGIGAFMVMPWIILHYAFAGRPRSLWWIDGGHTVAAFTVMGVVLGIFL